MRFVMGRTRQRTARLFGGIVIGAWSIAATSAHAQQAWPRFEVSGGAMVAAFDTTVRLDDVLGREGTGVDFEDDLGLDTRSSTWFAQGLWRIGRRHQLSANYQGFTRELTRTILDREVTFGGQTYAVGAEVGAVVEAQYLSVDYGFAFVATPRVEFGASIGVTGVRLESGIEASASVSGGGMAERSIARQVEYNVPVPLPGLFVNARLHPRLLFKASGKGLKGAAGDYSAALAEARAGLEVVVARPFSVGGAYYFNRARLTRRDTRTDGEIVYAFHGPIVYGSLGW